MFLWLQKIKRSSSIYQYSKNITLNICGKKEGVDLKAWYLIWHVVCNVNQPSEVLWTKYPFFWKKAWFRRPISLRVKYSLIMQHVWREKPQTLPVIRPSELSYWFPSYRLGTPSGPWGSFQNKGISNLFGNFIKFISSTVQLEFQETFFF